MVSLRPVVAVSGVVVVVSHFSVSGWLPVVPLGSACIVSCVFLLVAWVPRAVSCTVSPRAALVTLSLGIPFCCSPFVVVSC